MSLLQVSALSASYGDRRVLEDVSFDIAPGMLVGLLGENGSGKTTLLKSICGILPHGGQCMLDGQPLEPLSARKIARLCSYIPQRSGIAIDISALDVVLMGFNPRLRLLERPGREMLARAHAALDTVGLAGFAERNYLSLSEGQKQLCILARTLVSDTALMLLDEPESALDFRFRHRMLEVLRSQLAGSKRCALVSLHDPMLALNSCDSILLLHGGRISGILHPQSDSLVDLEAELSRIYGSISLHRITNRSAEPQLVMIKEDL